MSALPTTLPKKVMITNSLASSGTSKPQSLTGATGEIEQLTDIAPLPYPKEYSLHTSFVDGVRAACCFFAGDSLMLLDLKTKELREIYRKPPKHLNHISSITADGKYVLTSIIEDTTDRIVGKRDVRKIWETQPHSQILRIPVDGGALIGF